MVVGLVRTHSLEQARAYVTAYYLDRKGRVIEGTEVRSDLVGGQRLDDEWVPVTVPLPGNVPGSRYIGLSLWLTQRSIWDKGPRPKRAIERLDVEAAAWFDDITVYRLPRVMLRSGNSGNIFSEHEPVVLMTEVNDPDGLHLTATLDVRDAAGDLVESLDAPIQSTGAARTDRFELTELPLGVYDAELRVATAETVLVRKQLRFARLGTPVSSPAAVGRGFGVILDTTEARLLPHQGALLNALHPQYVKTPIWNAQSAMLGEEPNIAAIDATLEAIVAARADPVGIMQDEPEGLTTADGARMLSMVDVFSEDPAGWKPLIAAVWSRYAGLIHVWQLGQEGDRPVFLDDRLSDLMPRLRAEMRPLMSEPLLALPGEAHFELDATLGDYQAIRLPNTIAADDIARHLKPLITDDPHRTWITVEPLPVAGYERKVRLHDLARRLVEARYLGVGGVFLAAPWKGRLDLLNAEVNPSEDYIVLRTVADLLGDAKPISRMTLGGQDEAIVFDRNGQAIIFVSNPRALGEGRTQHLWLGENAAQVDLWGRKTTLRTVGSRQRVDIGVEPSFIIHTPTWLLEFRRQFRIEPRVFETSFDGAHREIVFSNPYNQPINGMLRLVVPPDWDIRPIRIPFVLRPGQEHRETVQMHLPINAESGVTSLIGEFSLDADRRLNLIVPTWFELGLNGVDVDTFVFQSGGNLIVRVTMTNQGAKTISFDGNLLIPGRSPITRLFAQFETGQSLTKDFVLENASELSGQFVRISLKEVQGGRIWNRVIQIP